MEGYTVTTLEDTLGSADIYVTATGNRDIITLEHLSRMKDQAIVCNIGHFDNEIQVERLQGEASIAHENIKPQVDRYDFPEGHSVYLLARAPREPRLWDRTSKFRHVHKLLQSGASADGPWGSQGLYGKQVYMLPKALDEEVAMLHLDRIGAKLTSLTKDQADYIGVTQEGPFKSDFYRY